MEISFCSHPNNNIVIATIFGTWHDSWAVVACAKFCRDMITSNWIKAKWNFHRIWIVMEKSLVKWVPGPLLPTDSSKTSIEIREWMSRGEMTQCIAIYHDTVIMICIRIQKLHQATDHVCIIYSSILWLPINNLSIFQNNIYYMHRDSNPVMYSYT